MFDSQLPLLQVATKLAAVANVAVPVAAAPLLAATSAALIRRRRIVKLFDILTSHLVAKCRLPHMPPCCIIFNTFTVAACGKLKTHIVREGRQMGGGLQGSRANYVKVGRGR